MTNEERLLVAMEYQQAMRAALVNQNLLRQGRRMNLPARQAPGALSEFVTQGVSLNPQPDQGYGTMAAEMALGFVPGVGQAMAARDLERARRDNDPLGMALAGTSFVPFGKLIGALRGGKQMGPVSQLDVYHGSPYKFDQFDASKIGTGQGAQTYGHGLYLAENPKVAGGAEYRDPRGIFARITGDMNNRQEFAHDMISQGREPAKVWEMMKQKYGQFFDAPTLKADFDKVSSARGSLYKVDLPDEQIAKMLDWDKPLSEQSWYRPVADVVKEYKGAGKGVDDYARLIAKANARDGTVTGGQFYEGMLSQFGGSQAKVSEFMRDAGIPGIRYLDQGSRNTAQKFIAQHPQGGQNLFNSQAELDAFVKRNPEFKALPPELTSNFVVFPGSESMLTILERNNQDVRNMMRPTVPESSLMYKDPFGEID